MPEKTLQHLSGTNPQANLLELCQKLRKQRLYSKSERELVNQQITLINNSVTLLFQELWQTWHLQLNLMDLELNNTTRVQHEDGTQSASMTPQAAQHRARRLLNGLTFTPATQHFTARVNGNSTNYEKQFATFLHDLRSRPNLLAACLNYGNILNLENSRNVVHTIMVTLYGNSIASNNYQDVRELLQCLAMITLQRTEDPKRAFMKSSNTFIQAFRLFVDLLPQTKLFVTTAFHETILQVLQLEPMILDVNPTQVIELMSKDDKLRRFGEGPDYSQKVQDYIQNCTDKLLHICNTLLTNIRRAVQNFPPAISWLLNRVYTTTKDFTGLSSDDAFIVCYELLVNHVLFPALIYPDKYGLCPDNVELTNLHRHNLTTIANILTGLKTEQSKVHKEGTYQHAFYKQLPGESIRNVVRTLIENTPKDDNGMELKDPNVVNKDVNTIAPTVQSILLRYTSKLFLITPTQLAQIILFLWKIREHKVQGVDQDSLNRILNQLPNDPLTICLSGSSTGIVKNKPKTLNYTSNDGNVWTNSSMNSSHPTSPLSPSKKPAADAIDEIKHNLSAEIQDLKGDAKKAFSSVKEFGKNFGQDVENLLKKNQLSSPPKSPSPLQEKGTGIAERLNEKSEEKMQQQTVLVFRNKHSGHAALELKILSEAETIEAEKRRLDEEKQKRIQLKHNRRLRPTTPGTAFGTTGAPAAGFNITVQHNTDSAMISAARSSQVSVNSLNEDTKTHNSVRFSLYENDKISRKSEHHLEDDDDNEENEDNDETEQINDEMNDTATETGRAPGSSCVHDGSNISQNNDDASSTESDTKDRNEQENCFGPPMTHAAAGPDPLDNMEEEENEIEKSMLTEKRESHSSASSDDDEDDDNENESIPVRKASSQDAQALRQLERNVGTSRETVEERMRKYPDKAMEQHIRGGRRFNLDGETQSECWSTDAMAESDGGDGGIDYERTLDGIMEEDVTPRKGKSQSKPRSNSQSSKLRISPSPGSKLQINQHSGDQLDSRSDIWSVEVSPTDTDSIDEDAEHEVARRNSNKQHKSSSKHSSKTHQNNNNNHPQESQNKLHGPVIIGGGEPQYQNASRNEKLSDKKIKQMNQMNHKITQLSQTQSQSSSNNQNQSRNNTLTRHDSDTASPNGLEKNTLSSSMNLKSTCSTPGTLSSGGSMEKKMNEHLNKPTTREVLDMFDPMKSSQSESGKSGKNTQTIIKVNLPDSSSHPSLNSPQTPTKIHHHMIAQSTPSSKLQAQIPNVHLVPDSSRRLRLILSSLDAIQPSNDISSMSVSHFSNSHFSNSSHFSNFQNSSNLDFFSGIENLTINSNFQPDIRQQLVTFLQDQLSVSLAMQNQELTVQIQETLQLVNQMTPKQCLRSVKNLWEDTNKFSNVYSDYLVSLRQNLLEVSCYFGYLGKYIRRDKNLCEQSMVRINTTSFINLHRKGIEAWHYNFRGLPAIPPTQRVDSMFNFLDQLNGKIQDLDSFKTLEEQAIAELFLERKLYAKVYKQALLPNGDIDFLRDEKYNEHLEILEETIKKEGPGMLDISDKYLVGAPWYPAVVELKMLNAFCSPRDKVLCIGRTCQKIVHLLKLSDPVGEQGADDILPVLIYVLIRSQPAHVLTTLEYIDAYYPEIQGEHAYQYTLFHTAVRHSKTLV